MRRSFAVMLVAALTAIVLPAPPAGAGHAGRFTCRASVIRIEDVVLLGTVEPIVANPQGDPCTSDEAGVLNDFALPAGLGEASVLFAKTEHEEHGFGRSEAGVVDVVLTVPGLPTIGVEVLTAEAQAGPCPEGSRLESDSTVVGLTVGGTAIEVPEGHFELDLGVATLHLNETISEPNRVTQRAFFLEVPENSPVRTVVGNIIIAEAVADFHGNPCETKGPEQRLPGWMNGGGYVAEPGSKRDQNNEGSVEPGTVLHHAINLDCFEEESVDPGPGKNNLVLQWFDEEGKEHSSFKLTEINDTRCFDDPALAPAPPQSTFDTIEGSGIGMCKSQGAEVLVEIKFRFTDAGEPGSEDRAEVNTNLIPGVDTPDELALICDYESEGFLDGGNHQAHQIPAQRAASTTTASGRPRPVGLLQ